MYINNNYNKTNFGAQFTKSKSLEDIAKYAIEHNKFDKLNQARRNIDSRFFSTRLRVDLCLTNDYPTIIFSKYEPVRKGIVETGKYKLTGRKEYISSKKENILKYGLSKIIKLGNNAPNNNLYKDIVAKKQRIKSNENFLPFIYDI